MLVRLDLVVLEHQQPLDPPVHELAQAARSAASDWPRSAGLARKPTAPCCSARSGSSATEIK